MTIGLTDTMRQALDAYTRHVSRCGEPPSIGALAAEIGCNKNNARRLIESLIERGHLIRIGSGPTSTTGYGGGVLVGIPPAVAAQLAAFALKAGEPVSAIVADAITLHIDQLQPLAEAGEVRSQ